MEYYAFTYPFSTVEISHYALSDFLGWDGNTDPQTFISNLQDSQIISLFFPAAPKTGTDEANLITFLRKYLLLNRFFSYCYWTTEDSQLNEERLKFKTKITSALQKTMEKYLPIISSYTAFLAKLNGRVGSKSETHNRYNDTPQGEQENNEWQGTEYTTTYTNNVAEAESDVTTPAARLKEIQESLENAYSSWLDALGGCFYELNGRR